MFTIEDAILLAASAHKGQKDLDGKPVILHPLTVGLAGKTEDEIICGILHDVLEDTDVSVDAMLGLGVPENIVDTLLLLTHDNEVPYMDYVLNICESGNLTALHVKLNDLHHNLSRGVEGGHEKQVVKHMAALKFVKEYMVEHHLQ